MATASVAYWICWCVRERRGRRLCKVVEKCGGQLILERMNFLDNSREVCLSNIIVVRMHVFCTIMSRKVDMSSKGILVP